MDDNSWTASSLNVQQHNFFGLLRVFRSKEYTPLTHVHKDFPDELYFRLFGLTLFIMHSKEIIFIAEKHRVFCFNKLLTSDTGYHLLTPYWQSCCGQHLTFRFLTNNSTVLKWHSLPFQTGSTILFSVFVDSILPVIHQATESIKSFYCDISETLSQLHFMNKIL